MDYDKLESQTKAQLIEMYRAECELNSDFEALLAACEVKIAEAQKAVNFLNASFKTLRAAYIAITEQP